MSWTRLDDLWTDKPIINELSFEDRWHYLAMIQFCSRTDQFDGHLRAIDAQRCSDHSDPHAAIRRMAAAGLLTVSGGTVRVNAIDEHMPPPSVRQSTERAKVRKRRQRAHESGRHSECLPKHCEKARTRNVTQDVTRDNTRDPGTGQNGKKLFTVSNPKTEVNYETGEVPETGDPFSVPARLKSVTRNQPNSKPAASVPARLKLDLCPAGHNLMSDGACWTCGTPARTEPVSW